MQKGKFIVIEGGEGSGKGMCIEFLKKMLEGRSNIVFTREPGGTPTAEAIRSVVLNKGLTGMLPLTELFLFCAARAQHITELVRPALLAGKHVVCDRFDVSTLAYQIYGRQQEALMTEFYRLNSIAKARIDVDHVIYLDVSPKVGLARKAKSTDGICTRFDEEKIEFHERVRNGFKSQHDFQTGDRVAGFPVWHVIDTEAMPLIGVQETFARIVCDILEIQNQEGK